MTATHSHVGYRRETGHVLRGRLAGHGDHRGGVHALTATDQLRPYPVYRAACGVTVSEDREDDLDGRPNVLPAADGWAVTCRRCRKLLAAKS